jgi:DnaJ-class molecular chaperone
MKKARRSRRCPICKGVGGIPLVGKGINLNPCPRCNGTGKVQLPDKEEQ